MSRNKFAEAIAEHDDGLQTPRDNEPAIVRKPTLEKLTGREMIEDLHPHTAAIFADEDSITSLRDGINDAHARAISTNDLERANANLALYSNSKAATPNDALAERNTKKLASLKVQRAGIDAETNRQLDVTPGSMAARLDEWLNSPAAYDMFEHAATPTDILPGETLLEANKRLAAELASLRTQKREVIKARLPAAVIAQNAIDYTNRIASKAKLVEIVSALRSVNFDERWGFRRKQPAAPEGRDAFALMCALLPDQVAASLTTRALAGHDEDGALDDVARMEKLNAIEDRMTEIEYSAESNHRTARARGEASGPRLSANALAILDLRPVKE